MGCTPCQCQNNTSLLERNLDTGLLANNLVYREANDEVTQSRQEKVKSNRNNLNKKLHSEIQNYGEKSNSETFYNIVPQNYHEYSRENPFQAEYDGDTSKLIEEEPVKLTNGNYYWGSWNEKCEIEGQGKIYLAQENIYIEGVWKEGICYYGRVMFPDKTIYEGEIKDCASNGKGKMIFPDGSIYEGQFVNNNREGRGSMKWEDGATYWGEFFEDQMHGEGELFWTNGITYHGQFSHNTLEGKGELSNGKKNKYTGDFLNNYFHGKGKFIWDNEDGTCYRGRYVNGKKQGKGKYFIKKDCYYKGKFSDEMPHGLGEIYTDTSIYKGLWRNGELIEKGEVVPRIIESSNADRHDLVSQSDLIPVMEFHVEKENLNPFDLPYLDHSMPMKHTTFVANEDIKLTFVELN